MPKTSSMTAAFLLLSGIASCVGTESGNPPFTTDEAIRIESVDGELEVVGGPGAVTPSDAEVQLINADAPAAPVVATVSDDGSFRQRLAGSGDDEVRLVALRERLRSGVLSLQVIQNDPASTDCVTLSAIEADVDVDAPASVDIINNCTLPADLSAARRLLGVAELIVSPDAPTSLGAGERRTVSIETSETPDQLTPEIIEVDVTVDGATAPRRISVFVR